MFKKVTGILFILLCLPTSLWAYTVLIDPGHGGEDTGAKTYLLQKSGGKTIKIPIYEKDIVLNIAQKLHAELQRLRYKSFLTRSLDRYVTLQGRADIADQVQADLFISIHLNSALTNQASGFETYYLDNHTDAAVQKVEEVENRALKGDELIIQQILIDLVVERTAKTSRALSESIHAQIEKGIGKSFRMTDRQTRPGVFYVLALAKRPATLIEAGFLSNQEELRKMLDPKFQDQLARDIARGVDAFMLSRQKKSLPLF